MNLISPGGGMWLRFVTALLRYWYFFPFVSSTFFLAHFRQLMSAAYRYFVEWEVPHTDVVRDFWYLEHWNNALCTMLIFKWNDEIVEIVYVVPRTLYPRDLLIALRYSWPFSPFVVEVGVAGDWFFSNGATKLLVASVSFGFFFGVRLCSLSMCFTSFGNVRCSDPHGPHVKWYHASFGNRPDVRSAHLRLCSLAELRTLINCSCRNFKDRAFSNFSFFIVSKIIFLRGAGLLGMFLPPDSKRFSCVRTPESSVLVSFASRSTLIDDLPGLVPQMGVLSVQGFFFGRDLLGWRFPARCPSDRAPPRCVSFFAMARCDRRLDLRVIFVDCNSVFWLRLGLTNPVILLFHSSRRLRHVDKK